MWSIRRASIHFKNRGLGLGTARVFCGKSEIERYGLENKARYIELQEKAVDGLLSSARYYNSFSSFLKSCCALRTFSSAASGKGSGYEDDDLDDGFSELEEDTPAVQKATSVDDNDDDLISEAELSEEENMAEADVGEKRSRARVMSSMTKAILTVPATPVNKVLDKWIEEGNEVTEEEVSSTMLYLRKGGNYIKALKMSEWLESTKHLEFQEANYASRVDLISKVRGIFQAENYIQKIPESYRGEQVYRTLLANCAAVSNVKKCEEVFNKMKNLGFDISSFSCNQLLLLYWRTDKKKIARVLLIMKKENIKPSIFTYQILIDMKGKSNDINGIEEIIQKMKDEGMEPNNRMRSSLARHYANAGLKEKAETVLKEMEGDDITTNRWVCFRLLPLYASLRREDEVDRIWKVCESNPGFGEVMAAIEAYGKLNKIEKAEAAFDKIVKKMKNPGSKHFTALLNVYINNKMLEKGKDLVKKMGESGCHVGPMAWDALVNLYLGAGEVGKADSILEKASGQRKGRPLYTSYFAVLDQYSKKGDIHNAEKIFLKMRQAGYVARIRVYLTLLQAYLNAGVPIYGFSDRMKADGMYPNKEMVDMLARADPFRKTPVSNLLD